MSQAFLKIGELATQAGVPIATLKHYVREGLVTAHHKTGRTMSWYAPDQVGRVRAIKELQRTRYLPLDVIAALLAEHGAAADDLSAAAAIARVLSGSDGGRSLSRDELLARGARADELDLLAAAGLSGPSADGRYRGDSLALLETLAAARRAGLGADMLPFRILFDYVEAIRALVAVELRLFRAGVFGRAPADRVSDLTAAATELSERLVVLLRRQLLLPTLHSLAVEAPHVPAVAVSSSPSPSPRPRRAARVGAPRPGRADRGVRRRRQRDRSA